MLIQKGNREDAIHALINFWLKDPRKYCVTCGQPYREGVPCCDRRIIGTNVEALRIFTQEIREIRDTRKNKFASDKDKTMRLGASIPLGLYGFLEESMKRLYGESLLTDKYNIVWFNKKFGRYFAVPEET